MRYFIVLLISWVISLPAWSDTILVPGPYGLTIQMAIDNAAPGDTLLVAAGTYLENIDFKGKNILVKSEQGPMLTVIDGGGSGPVVTFENGEAYDAVLEGFTITHGANKLGGGIYCYYSSPTIRCNKVQVNHAVAGGGIGCLYASPLIESNAISANTTSTNHEGGGGISAFYGAPIIKGNAITSNDSWYGGGIHSRDSSPVIQGNKFHLNHGRLGGGVCCFYSTPVIVGNKFHLNKSDEHGGGIWWGWCSGQIESNVLFDNSAEDGGGLFLQTSSGTLANNLIHHNMADFSDGGGMHLFAMSDFTLINNTVSENSATGSGGGLVIEKDSLATVVNSIFWNNHAPTGPQISLGRDSIDISEITISHSDVEGGQGSIFVDVGCTLQWGSGMIDSDPCFADTSEGDFHITYASPCLNTGDNQGIGTFLEDVEGDPRIHESVVDMGSDEFHTHLYHTGKPVLYHNGYVDVKIVGTPGSSPLLLWLGSGLLDPPLAAQPYGNWYLDLPLLLQLPLGAVPSPEGILVLHYDIPLDFPVGWEIHLQAFEGTRLTNPCIFWVDYF